MVVPLRLELPIPIRLLLVTGFFNTFFVVERCALGHRVSVLEKDQLERCRMGSKFSPVEEVSGKHGVKCCIHLPNNF